MRNNNIELITGFKFAEIADVIFSGVFLKSQIETLSLKENIENHIGESEYVFVRKKKFLLKENQIIFCKTEYIKELFQILRTQCNFKNIKLITHQSDLRITKKVYTSKPDCISKWYSINVDYIHKDLIPIPIGVANFHSKNLSQTIFTNNVEINNFFANKDFLLYLNFNPNTNFEHRKGLYKFFSKMNWVNSDSATLQHIEYKKNLSSHSFSLAPWGNGIDTHRFWETLYSGTIPITRKHLMYEFFSSIPKVLVSDYKEISQEFLETELKKLQKKIHMFDLKECDFKYWKKLIYDDSTNLQNVKSEVYINHYDWFYRNIADFRHTIKSKLKHLNRVRRLIYKVLGI